ncbi:uncharacterized protein LOC129700670 [Leucoraja erinacea]|uniref:uncharacterized protein LOC129700670 n=1 Tax=Leucoraja erinaceus TaxID=7782 RepID=UPI00245399B1|nr:uncharacterized protein LOC129700670 [Leucoraja erinacea]
MSVAVVDFGSFALGEAAPSAHEMKRLSMEIGRTFSELGFVYLKNTGIKDEQSLRPGGRGADAFSEWPHLCFSKPVQVGREVGWEKGERSERGWGEDPLPPPHPSRSSPSPFLSHRLSLPPPPPFIPSLPRSPHHLLPLFPSSYSPTIRLAPSPTSPSGIHWLGKAQVRPLAKGIRAPTPTQHEDSSALGLVFLGLAAVSCYQLLCLANPVLSDADCHGSYPGMINDNMMWLGYLEEGRHRCQIQTPSLSRSPPAPTHLSPSLRLRTLQVDSLCKVDQWCVTECFKEWDHGDTGVR